MPQSAAVVLADRAATPVNHTYAPRAPLAANGMEFVESTGVPIGDNRLAVELRKTATGRYKVTIRLTCPIVQTQVINGISTPVVVRVSYASSEFSFPETSTLQERKDIVGLMYSALSPGNTVPNAVLTALEGIW